MPSLASMRIAYREQVKYCRANHLFDDMLIAKVNLRNINKVLDDEMNDYHDELSKQPTAEKEAA